MNKYYIFFISLLSMIVFSAEYDTGDTIDMDDQNQRFDICNGEYFNGNEIKLSHVAEVTFQIDSDGQGKILLPNNTEILFGSDPKPIGRDDLAEFLNSVNLDPFEISRVQFTISKE